MDYILTIDQYKTQVQDILNEQLGSWITGKSGLHLSKTIDDILDDSKTTISDKVIKDNIKGADVLLSNNKIDKSGYNRFISNIGSKRLVHDGDGNWLPINKLNTNHTDVSKLLTDLLFDSYLNEKDQSSKEILLKFIYFKNIGEVKNILLKNKDHLIKLLNEYKGTPDVIEKLDKYTSNIINLSDIGEKTENKVVNMLERAGWKKLYQGGNGDFIDMLFSVDLIFLQKDTGVWTFQVKSSEKGGKSFIQDVENNKYKYGAVDYLIYPVNNKYIIYNLKSKEVIETSV
jgi:hypothetical protein